MKLNSLFAHYKQDLPAGLVVFLVALPLCLGIALASGAPLFSGIIAGILGGIVVGSLSASSASVSGPAAGLTVIILNALETLGTFEILLLATLIAGGIQFIMGVLKAGIISHYFPSSVIKGLLAAIGLTLILKQIPHAVGYDADYEGDFAFMQADGENTFSELFKAFDYLHVGAAIIALISLAILIIWELPKIKKLGFFKAVPGALVVVVVGVLLNILFGIIAPALQVNASHLVQLPVLESLGDAGSLISLPDFSAWNNPDVYIVAFTIAIIASIETLLNVEATDKIDPHKRITPTNRELRSQGIGNMLSGMIGGLPMTSVIVRSSANIAFGAQTKLSTIFHGILLLVCVLLIPTILNLIPLSALAAVLIFIGYKLTKIQLYNQMFRLGWDQFVPFVVTVVAIMFTDLLRGIMVGMVIAIFFILRNNYKTPYFYEKDQGNDLEKGAAPKERIRIFLSEEVTFLNKGSMLLTLRNIPKNSDVLIDGTRSVNIDYDVLEVINNFRQTAKEKNIKLELKNIPEMKTTSLH